MSMIKTGLVLDKLQLKNRLIMPPMATRSAQTDGKISQKILDYYKEKSDGGYFSLIITEHNFVAPLGRADEHQVSIASDSDIEGLSRLVQIIHKNGVKAAAQINHTGARGLFGNDNAAPSSINVSDEICKGKSWVAGKALTKEEISCIVSEFADAAVRAKKAGYDAVEIHSAHGYLLNQFYSPLTNHRDDEYGGDIYGRIQIHLEIICAVRDAVGEEFPLLLRLGACDYLEGGSSIEDAVIAAKAFEEAGIDILDISGGLYGYMIKGREQEQGYFSEASQAVKCAVGIPVILTGGITDINAAEEFLQKGKADLIGVGRAVLKDSSWAERSFAAID